MRENMEIILPQILKYNTNNFEKFAQKNNKKILKQETILKLQNIKFSQRMNNTYFFKIGTLDARTQR